MNFEFKNDAGKPYAELFSKYGQILENELSGCMVLNYVSSHDDSGPFDSKRKRTREAGTKLLLTPGASQVYYGDETGRTLIVEGTNGDATLRSFMNWEELEENIDINGVPVKEILEHWQKLGRFRKAHPAVGAGKNQMISEDPLLFSRVFTSESFSDKVIIGLDLKPGKKILDVSSVFSDGSRLLDYYSGEKLSVKKGKVVVDSQHDIVLLELIN